ncbi:aldehyde dehydrogenase family protein [Streptomyces hyaluromycini]|uniref:Aldehyde dehydrogenase family protein n=1 Tax=Streptomyces hyaluromycini TaxID=1377993 RepID=A0ABV1X035_9ACTN
MDTVTQFEHWIGGHPVPPASGRHLDSTSPHDGELVFRIADGSAEDVEQAVIAAHRAQQAWGRTTTAERSRVLTSIAAGIRKDIDRLVELECAEGGKLSAPARMELLVAADYFDYYGAIVRTLAGDTIDQGPQNLAYTRHEPYGVVAVITPWNGPLNQGCRGIAPALAAGNTVVLKPSEFTSATSLALGRITTEAGLPDGVLNVVTGLGPTVGVPLVSHPLVRRVSFTGSVATGRAIGRIAAERVIPVVLELGGKSPILVFADADLDAAARAAAMSVLINSGQVCSATTRLLVERSVQDELVRRIGAILNDKRPGEDFGPIVTPAQFDKVLGMLATARQEGADAAVGGHKCEDGVPERGLYIQPTVLTDVKPDMQVAREEIFGPVLVAMPFDTEDEAVTLANATEYGLAGAVWCGDTARGMALAHRIEAGQVAVNGGVMGVETPFGGYKTSGIGREKGIEALYEYTQLKTVSVTLPDHGTERAA